MIRINLLGKSKPKSKRSAMATTAIEFESGGSPNSSNVLAAIIVLAVTAGGIWWYQSQLAQQAADIKKQMDAAQRESQQLAQTKARFEQRQAVLTPSSFELANWARCYVVTLTNQTACG